MTLAARHPHRADVESAQLEKLNRLVGELLQSNPFYGRKFDKAGIQGSFHNLQEFYKRMPFTLKQELVEDQRENPQYGTNLTYPLERYTRYSQTSGTTGTPLRWLDTPESWEQMLANWMRVLKVADVTDADRIYFAFSFGPFLGFWTAFEAALRLDCMCLPGGGLSSQARLRAIVENEVTVLCCTPTYAIRLAEVAREENLDLANSKIRAIIVGGEPGGGIQSTRKRIKGGWPGARLFDHHGMTEVGPVTYASPEHDGILHVFERSFIAEVIDPETGVTAEDGDEGELVLTTLERAGSPLLRYRTGDRVQPDWSGEIEMGRRDVALVGGILGRVDDMVCIRGVNVHPSAIDEIVQGLEGIAEYQVHINDRESMPEMDVTIEPSPDCPRADDLAKRLADQFRTALHLRIPVATAQPGSLPRFEMKSRRWVRT